MIFLRRPICLFRIRRGDLSACVLLHLTYRIRGKSDTYFANCFTAVVSNLDLYWLPVHKVPHLIPIFRFLHGSKRTVRVRDCSVHLFDKYLRRVVRTWPKMAAGGPPVVGCPPLLTHRVRSYHPFVVLSSIRYIRKQRRMTNQVTD